jgi:hypothetical protein
MPQIDPSSVRRSVVRVKADPADPAPILDVRVTAGGWLAVEYPRTADAVSPELRTVAEALVAHFNAMLGGFTPSFANGIHVDDENWLACFAEDPTAESGHPIVMVEPGDSWADLVRGLMHHRCSVHAGTAPHSTESTVAS